MTNKNATKRALTMSVISMLICIVMLMGTTFAWFTDSVVSGKNTITAGNLDVELYYSKDLTTWNTVKDATDLFSANLWEPGHTEVVYLKVENKGTLALKYEFSTTFENTVIGTSVLGNDIVLSDYLEYGIKTDVAAAYATREAARADVTGAPLAAHTEAGKLEANQTSAPIAYVIYMPETVGNEANYRGTAIPEVELGVNLVATQVPHEKDSFDENYDFAAGTGFVGGMGTEAAPFLINEASQLMNISDYSDYTYFKVADGVETLDMTGVGKIKLNGSFDGNGVTMNNLTTALFQSVGKSGVAQDIKISNLTANVNTTDGNALVRNVYNPGTTTFENVALHGYIEGQYNMGSFYNYGTANAGDSDGADYTVSFVNATSDVTLVCTSGNAIGGMLGHGYEGANYKLSINMDGASAYTGEMYTTGTATCYEVMAMCSHATYFLNGVEVSRYDNTYPSTRLTVASPTAGADGYYVAPVAGVDHYVVSLEAQLTAYDENNVKIPNLSGLTWSLGKKTVSTNLDAKVLDLVTSAEIVNDADHKIGYDLVNGELKVYTGRDLSYKSGWITLNVTQYDADGKILATGNVRVHTFPEP